MDIFKQLPLFVSRQRWVVLRKQTRAYHRACNKHLLVLSPGISSKFRIIQLFYGGDGQYFLIIFQSKKEMCTSKQTLSSVICCLEHKMFFVLIILNGVHGFKVPGNCGIGHFYEPSLMDCLACPANASLVTSTDGEIYHFIA